MNQILLPSALLALSAAAAAAGTFNVQPLTGDADSGISGNNAYTHAIDMGDSANRTINGAVFTGGGLAGTNNYSTTGLNATLNNWPAVNPPGPLVTGATGGLFTNFNYQSAGGAETLTLNNLRVGQSYVTTFYNASWSGPAPRSQNITTSDGGAITFDQDAASGSLLRYSFTATSNSLTYTFAPNQVASFHQYAFTNQALGQTALLTDNFFAPSNPDTFDVNFNLAARQGGSLGPIPYLPTGNTQVGNPTGAVDGGNYLLTAFGARSALNYNFNGANSAGGMSISFDLAPNINGANPQDWGSINIGGSAANPTAFVNDPSPHLGMLFRGNGLIEVWDGSTNVTSAPAWGPGGITNALNHFELIITDPTDQNPFDGVGQTDVAVYANGLPVYNFSKGGGGYGDNFINFGASAIAGHDNLVIAQLVPEPGSAALAALAGLAAACRCRRRF
jgi:hypothetical protein